MVLVLSIRVGVIRCKRAVLVRVVKIKLSFNQEVRRRDKER